LMRALSNPSPELPSLSAALLYIAVLNKEKSIMPYLVK
jgi:hypothetical protein